jgi:hypothetical protein
MKKERTNEREVSSTKKKEEEEEGKKTIKQTNKQQNHQRTVCVVVAKDCVLGGVVKLVSLSSTKAKKHQALLAHRNA